MNEQSEYLLVLGCRVRGTEPEPTLAMRIEAAAAYLKEHPGVICIPCGGTVHSDQYVSEAQAIRTGLSELGVAENRIIIEDKSTTTVENFIFAREIINALEKDKKTEVKITFISSDFHLRRASLIAKSCGVTASAVPAPSPRSRYILNTVREYLCYPQLAVEIMKSRIRPRS